MVGLSAELHLQGCQWLTEGVATAVGFLGNGLPCLGYSVQRDGLGALLSQDRTVCSSFQFEILGAVIGPALLLIPVQSSGF